MVVVAARTGGLMASEVEELSKQLARIEERVNASQDLMEAKFVTFRTLLDAGARQVSLALDASDKAITKAEIAADKRFDLLNELRDDVATHQEVDSIEKQLTALKERLDKLEGTIAGGAARITDQRAAIGVIVGIAVFVLAIVVFAANLITAP